MKLGLRFSSTIRLRLLTKRATKMSDERKTEKEMLFNVALSTFEETMEFRMKHYGWRHPLVALNWQEKV